MPFLPFTHNSELPTQSRKGDGSLKSGTGGLVGANGTRKMDEEEERDAVFYRLEMLGYRVGQGLVERFVLSLSSLKGPPGCPSFYLAEADRVME